MATDFSPESLAAIPHAVSLAEEDEAQVVLLHVVGQPAAGIVDLAAVTEYLERRLEQLIPPERSPGVTRNVWSSSTSSSLRRQRTF